MSSFRRSTSLIAASHVETACHGYVTTSRKPSVRNQTVIPRLRSLDGIRQNLLDPSAGHPHIPWHYTQLFAMGYADDQLHAARRLLSNSFVNFSGRQSGFFTGGFPCYSDKELGTAVSTDEKYMNPSVGQRRVGVARAYPIL